MRRIRPVTTLPAHDSRAATVNSENGSFRDPSGHIYTRDGILYRQVNPTYQEEFDLLIQSGLYQKLAERKHLLVKHEEVPLHLSATSGAYKILRPELVPFISYPYEWCFSQLQDAALLTLEMQKIALEHDMSLKDASAFNVQFQDAQAIFIDTLSFERYEEGKPWVGYRQFCQHFLAPLALMSKVDVRLNQLLKVYLDGIPLDITSRILPLSSRFKFSLGMHIFMHAKSQKKHANRGLTKTPAGKLSKRSMLFLIESLKQATTGLKWLPRNTEWFDYYQNNNNYTDQSMRQKEDLVDHWIDRIQPKTVWDLGANTGRFTRIASRKKMHVISWDIDPACVELNYRKVKSEREQHILPLILDLTNPSPAIGWDHQERRSLRARGPADLILALGLVHHLAISNNVPLPMVAAHFAKIGGHLIIEFVPKEDSQVQKLLATRKDIFPDYNKQNFEAACRQYFTIEQIADIQGSVRTLYQMRNRGTA